MQLSLNIPLKSEIVHGTAFPLCVVTPTSGNKWPKSQLGDYADKNGVYILYTDGRILYVGKTTEGKFNFGERLYRHFHHSASGDSSLFKLLAQQAKHIYGYFLDLDDLDRMVDPGPMSLTKERKALVMEQVLIGIYNPEGNKQ